MDERPGCGETRELLPELAAGVAAGDDRARALRHLNGCAACRGELFALAIVADELIAWAPAVEPPAGFESAVLTRLSPHPGRWSPRRALRMVTVVGVAAAVGALAGAATVLRLRVTAEDRRLADSHHQAVRADHLVGQLHHIKGLIPTSG